MAGRFSVEAVFKAVDRVTAPINRMQNRVGKFTRSLKRGLDRVNRATGKVARGFGRMARSAARIGTAGIAAGALAVTLALNNTADAADALAKETRRLQFPIEEFQEWRFVAEQSGVSNELLSKSLGAFSKRLGEARAGTGPLVTGLKKINPQLLKQLNQTESVADAFELYIGAIRSADSATQKAALANAAFSRAGLQLTQIADNSTDAIDAMRRAQRENGNITQEQAEAAEAYNDAANSLKRSLVGLLQGVLLPMMPALTDMLGGWRAWIVANRELIQTRIFQFFERMKSQVKTLVERVRGLNESHDLFAQLLNVVDKAGAAFAWLAENGATIVKVVAVVGSLAAALQVLSVILGVVNLVMLANPVGLFIAGISAAVLALTALAAVIVSNWEPIKAFFADLWSGVVSVFDSALGALTNPLAALMGRPQKLSEQWVGLKAFFADLWSGIVGMFDRGVARVMTVVDKVKGAVASVRNFGGGIADTVTEKAGAAVSNVKSFFGFDDDDEVPATSAAGAPGPGPRSQIVSPQERVARSIEERRQTSTAEVTIRDETGRAEITRGFMGPGVLLQPSGGF